MTTQHSTLLKDFTRQLLEAEGALVEEIEPDGLEVVAPPHVQQALRLAELSRLGFATELPAGANFVSLESDWLERAGRLLGARGRLWQCVMRLDLPPLSDPARMLEHTLVLHNAIYRLQKVTPTWTKYLIFTFRYTAISDEKRDGILLLGVNLANGSTIDDMAEKLLTASLAANSSDSLPANLSLPNWNNDQIERLIDKALPARIERGLAPFLASLQRRMERDLARIHEYHQGLCAESLLRVRKHPEEMAREQVRQAAIEREHQAKVADLQQKYAMKIEVEWRQTLSLIMPVQRFELLIKRRRGERHFHLDWNPLARQLEQPPCEYSFTWEAGRLVCDDRLHLVSKAAHAPCTNCQREFCRACHPVKCPRCSQAIQN